MVATNIRRSSSNTSSSNSNNTSNSTSYSNNSNNSNNSNSNNSQARPHASSPLLHLASLAKVLIAHVFMQEVILLFVHNQTHACFITTSTASTAYRIGKSTLLNSILGREMFLAKASVNVRSFFSYCCCCCCSCFPSLLPAREQHLTHSHSSVWSLWHHRKSPSASPRLRTTF
jgi:hypothetical protein